MNKILNSVTGNFFTPERSDNKSFGNNLETNLVTSKALNSSESQSQLVQVKPQKHTLSKIWITSKLRWKNSLEFS